MTVKLNGHANRRMKALKMWLEWERQYKDGKTVTEIAKGTKKPNGTSYTTAAVYKAFERLTDL